MASECKRKGNKQSTITFTLPLSCQICLGKVKQPVLCPNHHVFCQLCMDIWLEKNKQCPTCRIEINEENPVKNIIGGQLEDEDHKKQSSAELRRARFELLYKEYEDQFDQMRKESIILRTENNILLAQLQDAEDKNKEQNDMEKGVISSSSSKNQPNLLMLTKNLQEAQTLYAGIKEEMAQLKQENFKLKDENINLTRENENLRLEIAQRSPKKYGRYTVATLETKLSEYEKEIRQLKKALERSDEYIEDLEKQIEKVSNGGDRQTQFPFKEKETHSSKNADYSEMNGHSGSHVNKDSALGSEVDKIWKLSSSSSEPCVGEGLDSAKRILFQGNSVGRGKQRENGGNVDIKTQSESIDREDKVCIKNTDSILKQTCSKNVHCGDNDSNQREKVLKVKKVHFDVPKLCNESAPFDLEMPSPLCRPQLSQRNPQSLAETVYESGTKNQKMVQKSDEVDGDPPSGYDFDNQVISLLKNAKGTAGDNHSVVKASCNFVSHPATDSSESLGKAGVRINGDGDGNDSSRLSLPDFDSPREPPSLDSENSFSSSKKWEISEQNIGSKKRDNMNGIGGHGKNSDFTDLDFSLTPEMSDCLRLMNQAERKLEMPHTTLLGDGGMTATSQPSYSSSDNSRPNSTLKVSHPIQSHTSSESMKGWEQEFFRGLRANPYEQHNFNQASIPSSISVTNNRNPFSRDFHDVFVKKDSNSTNTNLLNKTERFSSHRDRPTLSSISKPMSLTSTDLSNFSGSSIQSHKRVSTCNSIPVPLSNPLTYSTSKISSNHHTFSSTLSRDHLSSTRPSSAPSSVQEPSSSHGYHNALPSSLNSSSLEWPDSPVKNLISSTSKNDQLDDSDYVPSSTMKAISKRSNFEIGGTGSPINFNRNYKDFIVTSASSSFSSDINDSALVSEPKKRLFTIDDEFDLSMPSKTAKK